MGYPMTFSRFLARNDLKTGDYDSLEKIRPFSTKTKDFGPGVEVEDVLRDHIAHLESKLQKMYNSIAMIKGDLRRLEQDALDEHSLCMYISEKTDIDPNTVAGVLKEFLTW